MARCVHSKCQGSRTSCCRTREGEDVLNYSSVQQPDGDTFVCNTEQSVQVQVHIHTRLFAMRLLPDQINVVSCTRTKPANLGQEAKLQNASSSGNQLQHQHKHQNQHLNLAASLGQLKSHIKFIWPSSTATSCK